MKTQKSLVLFSLSLLVIAFIFGCSADNKQQNPTGKSTEELNAPKLRHVVLFKFKDTATPEDIQKVEEAFAALPGKISAIRDFEWGTNNSPENLNKGFTHCFLLTFHSEEDRNIYLPHPEHQNFGKGIGDYIDDVLVVDYWAPEE